MSKYDLMQKELATGWNTWHANSVTWHSLLPEGFTAIFGLKSMTSRYHKREFLHEERSQGGPWVKHLDHSYDGAYTAMELTWEGFTVQIETAASGDNMVALFTMLKQHPYTIPLLIVENGLSWGKEGRIGRDGDTLTWENANKMLTLHATCAPVENPQVWASAPYLALPLTDEVGVSIGDKLPLSVIKEMITSARQKSIDEAAGYGELSEYYHMMKTSVAWDTIYEPSKDRVVSPVSRNWCVSWGGYVLFDWDTYFAGMMFGAGSKELAYANTVEITRAVKSCGFVPNFTASTADSWDRSQPPVGAIVCMDLYRKFHDKWFLEEVYDDLLTWNRWWVKNRTTPEGFLCFGSHPFEVKYGSYHELNQHTWQCAAFESGLDNSPMYDDVPFNSKTNMLELADVGLMGLYVADCRELAVMAEILGKSEVNELIERAGIYAEATQKLWNNEAGIFLNKRTDTSEWSHRLSPTNFYPLIAQIPSQEQAERMMKEHFMNPEEFYGDWIMPSIARNDLAYPDQEYWRGRIWAPMNYLVYLGLRKYDLPEATKEMVEKSKALLMPEWTTKRHIHENYNADTGMGCDVGSSDPFYHWGALLALIGIIDAGKY